MKKFFLLLLMMTVWLAGQFPAEAQSQNKLIDKHRKAVGGGAAKRVRSTVIRGAVKGDGAAAGLFLYQAAGPDRLRIDIEAGDSVVSESYNGKSAWRLDGRGLRTLLGAEAKRLRLQALLATTRMHDLSRNRIFPQAPVKATVEGRDANAVEFIRDEVSIKLYFDSATSLIVKQERETLEGLEEVFYGDYRPVDGVMEPFSIRIKRGEKESLVTVDRVEHNRGVDETTFRHPQVAGSAPLPDLESLMKAVVANQEKIEELRELYTYRQTETEREMDKGRIKKSETRIYEVTPVAGRSVRRLVSRDGKELSASELAKEDKRVQKEVEDLLKEREKRKAREKKARERNQKEGDDEDENVTILSFLKMSEITSVRREEFRGHGVIAFDFEPRKSFKPKSRTEKLVSKLAGTMWIDEAARQIVRVEARLTDSFKMGGGLLASLSPSTAIAFEQQKIGDEVWLPSYSEANISARFLLLAKFSRNVVTRFSDYSKVKVESEYEVKKEK